MIDYAPKRRRKWKRGALVTLATLGALAWGGWKFGPDGYRKARLLCLQKLAVWQQPAEGTVVADTQQGLGVKNRSALRVREELSATLWVSGFRTTSDGTVVCAEVKLGGRAMLMIAEVRAATGEGAIEVEWVLLRPAGLKSTLRVEGSGGEYFSAGRLAGLSSWGAEAARATRVRAFAGRVEQGESPRFVFDYEIDGHRGTCGVRLYETGSGPATMADVLPPP